MGFFSAIKKIFKSPEAENVTGENDQESPRPLDGEQGEKPVSGGEDASEKPVAEGESPAVSPKAAAEAPAGAEDVSVETPSVEPVPSPAAAPVVADGEAGPAEPEKFVSDAAPQEKAEAVAASLPADVTALNVQDVPQESEHEEEKEPAAPVETEQMAASAAPEAAAEAPIDSSWALFEQAPAPESVPDSVFTQSVPAAAAVQPASGSVRDAAEEAMTVRLRSCEPRLSAWLDVVLEGVSGTGELLNRRIRFLLESLDAPSSEIDAFVDDFSGWLERMEYYELDEFRSELQYRLALALDLEDEEDERSRLFVKLSDGLAKTRAEFSRRLEGLFASHSELDSDFWEKLEELFIMADLGYEAAVELTERLKERARSENVTTSEGIREVLRSEIKAIFAQPRRILKVNPPEIVLMIGVNGAGKTTTIAKLAYRDRMQGKKVMIAAADTFRAAAIDQLRVWSERVGTLFHAKNPGSDPASVAYEAVGRALEEKVDVLYVDTAGRLQTKVNLMDELSKIRQVITKRHPGAPHRTVLVLDATTGQNALSQAKLFKESAGVDELILTKLDGTAKGGVAIAVSMQHKLPITYVGLGEKVEDLRPFNGDDYADALLASV